jgi:hypothetical protein
MSQHGFTRQEILDIVSAAIAESLRLSGREVPPFTQKVKPLKDIAGFDSPLGVEVTVDLEIQLGIDLPNNIFIKTVNGQDRARSFIEVVDVLYRVLESKGE